ncbi:acyl-CoA N-acyltransferase [Dichotomocladium elegans]|nr:acyl-CoA N-acyltransferase [Dichotomocladium elegans]
MASPGIQDTSIDRPCNVEQIVYGRYRITAWYYSPFPSEFGEKIDEIFICEHCLKYMAKDGELRAHRIHCRKRRPPGRVIYEEGPNKIYEVDGREHKLYCQNLCLLSKLFLETKTLYYDVEGFTFYVLTEKDRSIDLFVGYFSKEKVSYDNYNLACIMTLPSHQRKGYGRLLIELSYELSKREGVLGSPEKPLSTLGSLGYRSYWASALLSVLREFTGKITIQELSIQTGIHPDDVIFTLSWLGMLKYWEKDLVPISRTADHNDEDKPDLVVQVCIDKDMVETAIAQHQLKLARRLDPSLIRWQ